MFWLFVKHMKNYNKKKSEILIEDMKSKGIKLSLLVSFLVEKIAMIEDRSFISVVERAIKKFAEIEYVELFNQIQKK